MYKCKLIPLFFCMTLCQQRGEKWNKYCLCLETENSAFECWVLHDNKRSGDNVWSQVPIGKLVLVAGCRTHQSLLLCRLTEFAQLHLLFKQWWGGCVAKGAQQKDICLSSVGLECDCHFCQSLQGNQCHRNVVSAQNKHRHFKKFHLSTEILVWPSMKNNCTYQIQHRTSFW